MQRNLKYLASCIVVNCLLIGYVHATCVLTGQTSNLEKEISDFDLRGGSRPVLRYELWLKCNKDTQYRLTANVDSDGTIPLIPNSGRRAASGLVTLRSVGGVDIGYLPPNQLISSGGYLGRAVAGVTYPLILDIRIMNATENLKGQKIKGELQVTLSY